MFLRSFGLKVRISGSIPIVYASQKGTNIKYKISWKIIKSNIFVPYCKKRKHFSHFSIIITNGMSTLLACWIYRSCSVTKLVKWWQICKMKLYQWLSDVQIWLEPLIGPFIKLAMGPFKKGTGNRKTYQMHLRWKSTDT